MKAAGIFILYAGLLMTVYTGFTYVTREKVVDTGPIGAGLMILGGAALVFGKRGSIEA